MLPSREQLSLFLSFSSSSSLSFYSICLVFVALKNIYSHVQTAFKGHHVCTSCRAHRALDLFPVSK